MSPATTHSQGQLATMSPSRTRVSVPFFVFSIKSPAGCHLPGSPNATMADPPNLNTDFSLPREKGVSKGCTCLMRPTDIAPTSTKASCPEVPRLQDVDVTVVAKQDVLLVLQRV